MQPTLSSSLLTSGATAPLTGSVVRLSMGNHVTTESAIDVSFTAIFEGPTVAIDVTQLDAQSEVPSPKELPVDEKSNPAHLKKPETSANTDQAEVSHPDQLPRKADVPVVPRAPHPVAQVETAINVPTIVAGPTAEVDLVVDATFAPMPTTGVQKIELTEKTMTSSEDRLPHEIDVSDTKVAVPNLRSDPLKHSIDLTNKAQPRDMASETTKSASDLREIEHSNERVSERSLLTRLAPSDGADLRPERSIEAHQTSTTMLPLKLAPHGKAILTQLSAATDQPTQIQPIPAAAPHIVLTESDVRERKAQSETGAPDLPSKPAFARSTARVTLEPGIGSPKAAENSVKVPGNTTTAQPVSGPTATSLAPVAAAQSAALNNPIAERFNRDRTNTITQLRPTPTKTPLIAQSPTKAPKLPTQIGAITTFNERSHQTFVEADPIFGPRSDLVGTTTHTQTALAQVTPQQTHHVARQIAAALQQMPNRPVEITLNPEELGRVRLAVSATDAGITVNLMAERPETLELMRRHISALETAFLDIGYDDVAFAFTGGEQTTDNADADQSAHEEYLPDTFAQDTSQSTAQIALETGETVGLDIRV